LNVPQVLTIPPTPSPPVSKGDDIKLANIPPRVNDVKVVGFVQPNMESSLGGNGATHFKVTQSNFDHKLTNINKLSAIVYREEKTDDTTAVIYSDSSDRNVDSTYNIDKTNTITNNKLKRNIDLKQCTHKDYKDKILVNNNVNSNKENFIINNKEYSNNNLERDSLHYKAVKSVSQELYKWPKSFKQTKKQTMEEMVINPSIINLLLKNMKCREELPSLLVRNNRYNKTLPKVHGRSGGGTLLFKMLLTIK